MTFQNEDRVHQKEKDKEFKKSGAIRGKRHYDSSKIKNDVNTNFKKVPAASSKE